MATGPNHGVVVRPATADDLEFMAHLFVLLARQRHPSLDPVTADAIAQETREVTFEQVRGKVKDSTTCVIERNGERVGRLRVVRTTGQLEIGGIQVLPDEQGHGIGTAVITALVREGRAMDVPVVLEVWKDNPNAKRLYLRLGFEQVGETRDTFLMRRQ